MSPELKTEQLLKFFEQMPEREQGFLLAQVIADDDSIISQNKEFVRKYFPDSKFNRALRNEIINLFCRDAEAFYYARCLLLKTKPDCGMVYTVNAITGKILCCFVSEVPNWSNVIYWTPADADFPN